MKKYIALLLVLVILLLAACGMVKEPLENVMVRMYTTEGVVELRLYDDTPAHRDNFVKLVKEQEKLPLPAGTMQHLCPWFLQLLLLLLR